MQYVSEILIRLFELPPELGGSTGGGAMGEVEDWQVMLALRRFQASLTMLELGTMR